MANCRTEIEKFIAEGSKSQATKAKSSRLKKSASYLSMENLDFAGADEDEEE